MPLDGEGVVGTDELRPVKRLCPLEQFVECLGAEGADLDEDPLGGAQPEIGAGDGVRSSGIGYPTVYRLRTTVSKRLDLFAEYPLKSE